MRTIKIVFKPDGTTEVDATGFTGGECVKSTEEILKALETKLEKRKVKKEFYAVEKAKSRVNV